MTPAREKCLPLNAYSARRVLPRPSFPARSSPGVGAGRSVRRWWPASCSRHQHVDELGLMALAGYFSSNMRPCARSRSSTKPRRPDAQAPSGDVQSGASLAPDRERPKWRSPQLPVVLRVDRTVSSPHPAAAAFARDAAVHLLRTCGPVHRRGCLTQGISASCKESGRGCSLPGGLPGSDFVVGRRPSGAERRHAPALTPGTQSRHHVSGRTTR
jgi:hypothetical protein